MPKNKPVKPAAPKPAVSQNNDPKNVVPPAGGFKPSTQGFLSISNIRQYGAHRLMFGLLAFVFGLSILAYFSGGPGGGGANSTANSVAERNDEVIATVNGEPVRRGAYDRTASMMRGSNDPQMLSYLGMILSQLIDQAILTAEAKKQNLTVTDADVEKTVSEMRKGDPKEKPKTDAELATTYGMSSINELKDRIKEGLLPSQVGMKLANAKAIGEAELEKSYDELKIRHILFSIKGGPRAGADALDDAVAKKKAEETLAKLNSGGNFEQLANQLTMDPSNKQTKFDPKTKKSVPDGPGKGGDLGWYKRGGGFAKEFEDAAFLLKAGQISPLVKTPFGYHIIKVDQTRRELPKDYKDQKATYLERFRQQKATEKQEEFLKTARASAQIAWKDSALEWRYLYGKANPSMSPFQTMDDPAKNNEILLTKLRAHVAKDKNDGLANLTLGRLLENQLLVAAMPQPGAKPTDPPKMADPSKLAAMRTEIITAFEAALASTEDQQARFSLARLYQETKQDPKALDQLKRIQKLSSYDDNVEKRFVFSRLEGEFKKLGQADLAAQAAKRYAELDKKAKDDAAKKAEEDRKAKADADKKAAEAKAEAEKKAAETKAKAGTKPTTSTPDAKKPESSTTPAPKP